MIFDTYIKKKKKKKKLILIITNFKNKSNFKYLFILV